MTAWLLLFLLMPPVGAAIYLVFGARKLRRRAERKPGPAEHDVQLEEQQRTPVNDLDHLIQSYRLPPATDGNLVTLCGTAVTAYGAVLDLIDRAEVSLWVTTYVLGDDPVGHEVVRRLTEKAGAGVQVRLLIDDVGSNKLPDSVLARLISAGGRAARFMPTSLVPRSRHYANLRSHRKIIIVDRREAWSGGMNLSEQYLGPAPVENGFRDLSFVVKGPAAEVYGEVFAADWLFTTGEDLRAKRPWTVPAARAAGPGVVQVVPSGPEFEGDTFHDVLLSVMHRAERRLWVVSPYFVPDFATLKALAVAARRGLDVRVLTHRKSDHALMDVANVPYLRLVSRVGGRILLFGAGMLHAKAVVADDDLALVGTANLDQRSFFLNFEVVAVFSGPDEVAEIANWMEGLVACCDGDLPPLTPMRHVMEGAVRLLAPVL
jgi:cardiolipin synthase